MTRKFTPLGDRVVVKPILKEAVTKGGIVLPDTAKEKPQEGEVIAVGPGHLSKDRKRVAMEVRVGDRVLYAKYAGTELEEDGEYYLILKGNDILAKINFM